MKRYIKSIMLFAAAALGFASCEDYPDAFVLADGVPSVDYVRYADREVLIEQAYMGEIVCFVGENLCSVRELYFNEHPAVLNTSYMTANTLIAAVPGKIPQVKTDKVYMITKNKDTVTVDFKVMMPAPQIKSMSCEFQKPGTDVTVYGNYFAEPMTLTFEDGAGVEVTSFKSVSMTEATFTIPAEAKPGRIKVETESGLARSPFSYMDASGMLFDFDDDGDAALATNVDNCWHKREIKTDDTAIDGNYLQLGDGSTVLNATADWNDGLYAFEYWCGTWSNPQNITSGPGIALYNIVDFSDYANMALKFEMCIPASNPWMAGAMQIAFQPITQVTVSGEPVDGYDKVGKANASAFNGDNGLGDWGRAMYRPWAATGSYDTGGKWVTVTVPVSEFTFNKDGNGATKQLSSELDFASLTMFVVGGGVAGKECAPVIKIDNIRAVPVK